MKSYLLAVITALAVFATMSTWASASEATFDRTLSVSGRVELSIDTGSGTIHITPAPSNQVHVFGRVRAGWGVDEGQLREIAAHPPIEQTGGVIRIGRHKSGLHNISIDYEIQAPANCFLTAETGSGEIRLQGVGQHAQLSTGSGDIRATGLPGSFYLSTGSGDIYAEQAGQGDGKAETGSGSIVLKNLRGGLRASTGSGDLKVAGNPLARWKLETGSGDIEIWTGDAPITLDASSGSGSIHIDRNYAVQGASDRHHLNAKLNGGGPEVEAETGSGGVRVH